MSRKNHEENPVKTFTNIMIIAVIVLFVLFSCGLIYECAIIPGLSKKQDEFKKEAYFDYQFYECCEGRIVDCNDVDITVPTNEKAQTALIDDDYAYAFGWILGTRNVKLGIRNGIRTVHEFDLFDMSHRDRGATIKLTTDKEMQKYTYELLDQISDDGSIIVLDNQSGAIKAFATRGPLAYNGNYHSDFNDKSLSIEASRYMRGIYEQDPPASVFKLVTLACAIENEIDFSSSDFAQYYDDGTYDYSDGTFLTNYQNEVYGTVDLQKALNNSINTYFAYVSDTLGKDKLAKMYDKCLIGTNITLDFRKDNTNVLYSSYNLEENNASVSHSGIGQGLTQITPLHLTSIIASFANEGKMMQPYMVQSVDGKDDFKAKPIKLSQICSKETCDKLNEYAHKCALSYGFSEEECGWVCAKTGTAQFDSQRKHSYLVAYNQKYTFLISCNDVATSTQLLNTMKTLLMQYKVN